MKYDLLSCSNKAWPSLWSFVAEKKAVFKRKAGNSNNFVITYMNMKNLNLLFSSNTK